MQVVWFKRDLRVSDHAALAQAARRGPVLPLYVVEPGLWLQPDASERQWGFVAETLAELRDETGRLGQPLIVRVGTVIETFEALKKRGYLDALWSHEETGNDWTYRRDKEVAAWCDEAGVPWYELQNHGVIRRLKSRNGWANRWDAQMVQPTVSPPQLTPLGLELGTLPSAKDLGLQETPCPHRQAGGRKVALEVLSSFLNKRGEQYQRLMSSPLRGAAACSRLSPYLAWGAVSIREVAQATEAARCALPAGATEWQKSMRSFSARLHWHCHFIQKLEDEPQIEFRNLHPLYDDLRPKDPEAEILHAWSSGETGYPFLDACMRSLRATGWLNFRMRAMVMATASYHLWLHWRAPGLHLARMFTDYEPGIHWSQVQMQSGTTGINTVRIYNPVKQGLDQDPKGRFIRRWVPELAEITDQDLHEPWNAENADAVIDQRYPRRVFDHLAAAKAAREKVWAVRRRAEFRDQAQAIAAKHASRKSGRAHKRKSKIAANPAQLSLPLGDVT
ncbi:deoxyribodipyrimidine photo-lyase [Shimia sp. R9_1]|uniref:FAD-binding domain-containing protein n=1 Tax=Shimia sp. R9_1 TaxID=2821111 RepID=UPI001ADCA244|nr:FAD-binding domain-containing protein [Shimia sp. R9_1]MBO9409806.1 deoxyribodipyrimidine photo-lyase [Shimia sp. R9_1]